jgi:excisionase family DNA binding protein
MSSVLLTLDEAAAELRISRRTLERRIDAGRLATVRDGRTVRIARAELRRYIASATTRVGSSVSDAASGRSLAPGERLW